MSDTDAESVGEVRKAQPAATVSVNGEGVSITRSVDEATLGSIVALLFGGPDALPRRGAAGSRPEDQIGGAGVAGGFNPDVTLGEFLDESGASSFSQKICAVGYYLTQRGADSFDRDGVRQAMVDAREDMPGNFARDFTAAISGNLITPVHGDPKKFYVTKTGRKAVESKFQEVPKRPARRARRTSSGTTNGPSA